MLFSETEPAAFLTYFDVWMGFPCPSPINMGDTFNYVISGLYMTSAGSERQVCIYSFIYFRS